MPLKLAVTPFHKGRSPGLPKAQRKEAAGLGSESVQAGSHSLSPILSLDSFLPPRGLEQLTYVISCWLPPCLDEPLQSDIATPVSPKYRIMSTQSLFSVTLFTVVFVLWPQLTDTIGKGLPKEGGGWLR